ncbi:MAG: DegT/DnrJ/EryC1/StrS family aminotransferase [Candidatus Omnitrophota bacterium]
MRTIPFGKPIIGEEEKKAVLDVLSGSVLVHGPKSKEFEAAFAQYTKAPFAVSVASCTAGLHLAYFYLGIGPGDEVIVPAQTHTATAHAVEFCGARPVFVDAEGQTGNVDIQQVEKAITPKTKAISLVHFLGMPVDMGRVSAIARKHNLFVVEDCALALGTYYKGVHAGLHGDVGVYSFYPVKHMTTAEGGMVLTRHKNIAEKIQKQKAFGVDRHVGERAIPGVYDVTMLGFNYRMNEMAAVMGIEQLKRMDGFLKKRRENFETLERGFRKIDGIELLQSTHGDFQSSYYCFSVILEKDLADKRFEIIAYLKSQNIGTSVYYPKPVPHFTYYQNKYGFKDTSFPAAARISYRSIALPVGPHLDKEDMEYIVEEFKKAMKEVK